MNRSGYTRIMEEGNVGGVELEEDGEDSNKNMDAWRVKNTRKDISEARVKWNLKI